MEYRTLPAYGSLLLKAVLSRKRGLRAGEEAPSIGPLVVETAPGAEVRIDGERLAAYRTVCGFTGEDVPVTYPQVLAAPLHLALLTSGAFPYSAMGLVHVRNAIVLRRPVRPGEALGMRVTARAFRAVPAGLELELVTVASAGGETAWEGVATLLVRSPVRREGGRPAPEPREPWSGPLDTWSLPADQGRRYARVSGDYNPIHLFPFTARLFGFQRPIAHGMFTLARAAAALSGRAPTPPSRLSVRFRRPVLLPSRVSFLARDVVDGADFRLSDPAGRDVFLEGEWRAGDGGGAEASAA